MDAHSRMLIGDVENPICALRMPICGCSLGMCRSPFADALLTTCAEATGPPRLGAGVGVGIMRGYQNVSWRPQNLTEKAIN